MMVAFRRTATGNFPLFVRMVGSSAGIRVRFVAARSKILDVVVVTDVVVGLAGGSRAAGG